MWRDQAAVPMIYEAASLICLIWSLVVFLVQGIGIFQLFRYLSSPPPKPVSPSLPEDEVPHVTIIRPVKGWEPGWYDCLASTFRQTYPNHKMTTFLCVSSADDPSYAQLDKLLREFPDSDASILVEEQDPILHGSKGRIENLGPNPKIRNVSRAYREAKGDVIWIVDANVWISKGTAGRMVDRLYGFSRDGQRTKPFKFVHQLPLTVDTTSESVFDAQHPFSYAGGLLDEMFMASTHAKFYNAINTVGVAPCIVGKSNMFRKSHLDRLTDPLHNPILSAHDARRGRGIDFFSGYICEDHLIGDLLWRSPRAAFPGDRRFGNHALAHGDVAIQPMARTDLASYAHRRVRWLRVRKFTVVLATLVEPGVESLLCCAYFAFAVTAHPGRIIPPTWPAAIAVWLVAVTIWMLVDRAVYNLLSACRSVEVDANTPDFARGTQKRPFWLWLAAWVGREVLALPIWTWAVLLGTAVEWRGKMFKVRMDMSVVEISPKKSANRAENGDLRAKHE